MEKFDKILQNQSNNTQKEVFADFILQNNQDKDIIIKNVKEIINKLSSILKSC